MTKPIRIELPVGVQLIYLAEGGANVIYRIVSTCAKSPVGLRKGMTGAVAGAIDQSGVPPEFRGKLLRLRKDSKTGISYQEIVQNFDKIIRPLFNPEELVDQTLVTLPNGLVQRCNEQLHAAEVNGRRPKKRRGVYLSTNEPYGLLITDMTTFNDPNAILAELKPKWLLQSPSAPIHAQRCRTCALWDMKNGETRKAGGSDERSFCPLDLMSDNFETVLRATGLVKGCKDQQQLARVLYRNRTLQKLHFHQKTMRDVGLHGPSAQSREKSLAMTLRDCTMFIKMPCDDKGPVEVRLGDLDLKTGAGGKAQYWLNLEKRMVDEGWYMGTPHPSECALQGTRCNTQSSI
ncbi:hypothetical protein ASPWEDRAFT_166812 [Aspergillus wentii DTO 134E9]|uniref:Inositol-pentakisphosphate 2-kinase n=1 Tax=Aspergillus wentii DTO 134E9 TaxID=1073089 RepID=A0A1L9S0R3_ASPWE|nr:uncharacterized protein ASPWEDRAFT_166812 [Aspergillus wentii DTO 134E9]KAI9931241.1 Inositol-pentakisphosphate 2-kinase [Aspergillus wentii]OJJ40750.1 hypothetical protein ASPWEDRAFT_166812 [Aspergillus wentii DTO 134E9]